MYSLVASAVTHPDQQHPLWGLFNRRSLDSLTRSGVDVTAAVPRPHAPPVGPHSEHHAIPARDEQFSYPVSHPRFLYYLPKSLLYHRTGNSIASTLASWYADETPGADVLHGCHLYPDGYALRTVATAHSLPLTAYAHGTIINEFERFNGATQDRIEQTLRETDRIFCSGRDIRSKIHCLVPSASTQLAPLGATPAHFPVERKTQLRRELRIPLGATVVLFCGHLSAAKGVDDLLETLPELTDEDLYVVFVGHGGDLKSQVQAALASEETPPGTLRWKLPPVAVRRWFAAADLLVLPSESEGRPTVVYEAMASQTPVLATAVGGIPEQVADGTTGWLVDPGDRAALRAGLTALSRDRLEEMGMNAEARLREQGWTWRAHADALIEEHTTLLDVERPDDADDTTLDAFRPVAAFQTPYHRHRTTNGGLDTGKTAERTRQWSREEDTSDNWSDF